MISAFLRIRKGPIDPCTFKLLTILITSEIGHIINVLEQGIFLYIDC